jgi:WD40 repeat protein
LEEAYSYFDLGRRKQLLKAPHLSTDKGLKRKILYTTPKPLLRFEEEALFGQESPGDPLPEVLATDAAEERLSQVQCLFLDGKDWYSVHTQGEVSGSDRDRAHELEEALGQRPLPCRFIGQQTPVLGVDGRNQLFLIDPGLTIQGVHREDPELGLGTEKDLSIHIALLEGQGKAQYLVYHPLSGLLLLEPGKLMRPLMPRQKKLGEVTALAGSGHQIILGTQTGEVYRLDREGTTNLRKIPGLSHQGKVSTLKMQGNQWLSYGEDKTLFLGQGDQKPKKIDFRHPIEDAILRDGVVLVLTSMGLYDLRSPEENLLPGLQGGISLGEYPGGLCLGDRKGRIHFLSQREQGVSPWEYQGARIGHGDWPMVYLALNKGRLLSGSLNGSILEWGIKDRQVIASHCPSPAHHLGFWHGKTWFTVGENYLLFWQDSWEPQGIFSGEGSLVTMVKASPRGGTLAVGEENGALHLLSSKDGATETHHFPSAILSLCWQGEKRLVVGFWDGELGLITPGQGYHRLGKKDGPVLSLKAGSQTLYAGDNQGFITALDYEGEVLWKSEPMGEAITALCPHPEEKFLYAGGGKGSLLILRVEDGLLLGEWQEKGKTVWSVESRGNILLVRREGREVMLWLLPGFGKPLSLKGHRLNVESFVLMPAGNGLLTASADGYLRLWRLPDGELVKKIPGPREGLQSLAINSRGSEVWALSKSGSPLKIDIRAQG